MQTEEGKKMGEPSLYGVLHFAFPQFRKRNGRLAVTELANHLGVVPNLVQTYLRDNTISRQFAKKLTESGAELTIHDLVPFLLPKI